MSELTSLTAEFAHEMATTRRYLERLPDDRFAWRPHARSFTAGELAAHIVECVNWAASIFGGDELDMDPATFTPFAPASGAALLEGFDEAVSRGAAALGRSAESSVSDPWRFKIRGRVRFERPRAVVFRDFTISHVIHHRGQLSVYLRLLDLPVPGAYGPSADERG
jgi:uncharacterized damage-inducible protein DinB